MSTAIYMRVSSSGQTTASQEPDLKRWARAAEGEVAWYRDTFTGRTLARPGWARLWADVLAGRVKRIVVWRIDRLGRTSRGLHELFEELIRRDVALVSIRESFDLATPGGRLLAGVMASVAQYETELRSERQVAGIAAAKERGVKFGRPKVADGERAKRIKVTPEQAELAARLDREGRTVSAIARTLGLSRPTVYQLLGRPGVRRGSTSSACSREKR